MTIIRASVDTAYFEELKYAISESDVGTVTEALSLLSWAINERQRGRVICSVEPDGTDVARLSTKNLDFISKIK